MNDAPEVLFDIKGGYGWITLNRPKALNALSLGMFQSISKQLKKWETDSSIQGIIVEGSGERAFCAGGDVRSVYEALKEQNSEFCDSIFRTEYTLNTYLKTYSKPYVSLINGIAMGGGLGISVNGNHRVVTEKSLLAMPESSIGFFTDVGATHFLNEIPNTIGLYLGLTGTRLNEIDAIWSGLATHFVPSSALNLLKNDFQIGIPANEALANHSLPIETESLLSQNAPEIDQHFNQESVEDIFNSLKKGTTSFAKSTYETLLTKSPTSLAVIFHQLKLGKFLPFHDQMKMEFRISQHLIQSHDFSEGIRAVLVDKDNQPQWNPKKIKDVDVESFFQELGERELTL